MKALIMVLSIVLCFGCGVRKVDLAKSSSKDYLNEQIKERLDSIDKSLKISKSTTDNNKDVTQEEETETTTTKYKDGKVVETTTTKTKGRITDKSKIKATDERTVKNDISVSKQKDNSTESKKEQNNKKREVDKDGTIVTNVGGRWTLIIIVIILGLIVAGYFYLKK